MGEVEAATVEQLQELEQQIAALAEQHAADIDLLQTEFQSGINRVTGAIGDMSDEIASKIDLLTGEIGKHAGKIVDALLVLQDNDLVMYEVAVYILGILFIFVIALLAWGVYKFIRIFF